MGEVQNGQKEVPGYLGHKAELAKKKNFFSEQKVSEHGGVKKANRYKDEASTPQRAKRSGQIDGEDLKR